MSLSERFERLYSGGVEDASGQSLGLTLTSGIVAAAVLSPILWLFLRAFHVDVLFQAFRPDVTAGEAFAQFFSLVIKSFGLLVAPSTIEILLNSVLLVVSVTFFSVLIGVPLAVLTVQTDLPFRRFWTIVVSLPLVIPSYIGAFAFVSAFGPRGELADLLAPLGIERLPAIYGFEGATLVLTLFVYPYVFLTTRAALLSFDTTLVEAARTLDHTHWEAFKRVTLPQIAPGITAGALLVALYALSDFGTPAIMHYDTFTRMIYVTYNTFARDMAALLSLQLLVVTVVILAIESRVAGGEEGAYASRGSGGSARIRLGWMKIPALLFCLAITVLCLGVPIGVLFLWLERAGGSAAGGGFAFEWQFGINSVYVSALAALVTAIAAIPVAYFSARSSTRLSSLFDRATYVGYAVPGIVLGLSLVYFGANYAGWLYQQLPLLIFAYVVRFLPQAVGTTRSSVLQVDPKLVEAARTLGHSPKSAFRRVTFPLIAPGVAAGAALVFLTTMKELPATLLLHPTGFETLVTYIWRVQSAGYYGQAAMPALVLVAISALSMVVILAREGNDV